MLLKKSDQTNLLLGGHDYKIVTNEKMSTEQLNFRIALGTK